MKSRIDLRPKVSQYLNLQRELRQAKEAFETELRLISEALGAHERARLGRGKGQTSAMSSATATRQRRPGSKTKQRRATRKARATGNTMTLREAVNQVLRRQPMSKKDILTGVEKLGYRSSSAHPIRPLSVFLYRNYSRTKDGRFIPAKQ